MTPRTLSECTLLAVDDEPANLELLEEFLAPEGLGRLVSTSDAREAVPLFEAHAPDRPRFVNAALIRGGYAETLTIPPNDRFAPLLRRLELRAARAGRGLWGACPP